MRLAYLYLRSRSAFLALCFILGTAAITAVLGVLLHDAFEAPSMFALLSITAPLLVATVAGISTRAVMGDLERSSGDLVARLRFAFLAGLVAIGTLTLWLAGSPWPEASEGPLMDPGWTLARNTIGFTGLAFIAGRALGASMSWVLPLAYGVVLLVAGPGEVSTRAWAWPLLPADDMVSGLLGLGLFGVGLALITVFGVKEE